MSSLFNSASLRRLSGSPAGQPPAALPDGGIQDGAQAGPPSAAGPLPYQPRRRTPGGSTSSIPPPLVLAGGDGVAGNRSANSTAQASSSTPSASGIQQHAFPPPPGVHVTSPTSSSIATVTAPTTHISRLFSHPVTPTTSTTDLSSSASLTASTETLTAAPAATSSTSSASAAALPSGGNLSRAASLSNKDATGRLQLTNLKATAQRAIGLSNDSLGMRMLEALVQDGSSTAEWRAVVDLLLDKKVTLLLPAAAAGITEVTLEIIRDHLALVEIGEGSLRSGGSVCVLLKSGLVGRLGEEELAFESFLPPDSPALAALLDPQTRKATLGAIILPPAPPPPVSPSDAPADPVCYPSVTPTLASLLPFPPPSPAPLADADANLSPQAASKSSRRASLLPTAPRNPFAGFFGRPRAASANPATTAPDTKDEKLFAAAETEIAEEPSQPMDVELQPTPPDSRPLSIQSGRSRSPSPARSIASSVVTPAPAQDVASAPVNEPPREDKHAHLVSALGISTALKPTDMFKALGKAWRARLAEELVLDDHPLPLPVVKIVQRFACLSLPTAGQAKSLTTPPSAFKKASSAAAPTTASTATLPPPTADPELLAAGYQEFYTLIHEELEVAFRKEMVRALAAEEEGVREAKREEREREIEKRALEGVDVIEGCLARLHYNILFSPERSSDKRHDEVLASRIAALSMLGLTLDHLGVVTTFPDGSRNEAVRTGLEGLVKTVGDELQRISAIENLSTRSKAQVLVSAHKVVIEGLRQLPPIRLRPEGEEMPPSTPLTAAESSTGTGTPVASPVAEEEEVQLPPSPPLVVKNGTGLASDATSVASDPLLVGGLEEAMAGSVMDLPSNPEQLEGVDAAIRSPLDTPSDEGDATAPIASVPSPPLPSSAAPQSPELSASGADLLLPLIIFAVVRSNPPQLVSHLLYIQRYRPTLCFSGEASYALVNLTAVVDFLENVNLGSLGLAGEGKVLSADFQSFDEAVSKDLAALSTPQAQAAAQSRLRGRVTQVSDFASSGLNNVAATGLGALRSLIENGQLAAEGFMIQVPGVSSSTTANPARPTLLGRKTSGFSIANLATSVAGIAASAGRAREGSISSLSGSPAIGSGPAVASTGVGSGGPGEWGVKREMVDVSSRPGSIFERAETFDNDDQTDSGRRSDASDDDEGDEVGDLRKDSDARSIRSTRSVASTRSLGSALKADNVGGGAPLGSPSSERLSISERFARMSTGGGGGSGGDSPVGLGVASSLPKATPFLPTHKTRSASNSVSSLTPSTRRATILGNATYIPPPSPTRPTSAGSPPTTSPSGTPLAPPPLSQAHLSATSSLTSPMGHPPLPAVDKPASPTHVERCPSLVDENGTVRPPLARFLDCPDAGDLKLCEVASLLHDYQRLAGVLRTIGVWDD